ncbi:MAG: hypothetical protein RI947_994 [Candidatus Parcubacteria bacterium]
MECRLYCPVFLNTMKLSKTTAAFAGFYVLLVLWWVFIFVTKMQNTFQNYAFAFAYGLLPLFGGITGMMGAKKWGFFKSAVGKALVFMSLGLITWGIGEMIWSYYNFALQVEIPYPSWPDAFFIVSWPLWSIGVYFLSFATGAHFGLKTKAGKMLILVVPILAVAASYYLLITVARGGEFVLSDEAFKAFFDLAYPIGDVVILTLASLMYGLSFKYLGGRFKWPVLIFLLGFVANYVADFSFSYTTTVGTFYNGNWVDLSFTTAMFLMVLGVNSMDMKG